MDKEKEVKTEGYRTTIASLLEDENGDPHIEVLLEDENGGSYTVKKDDKCVVLINNANNEYATHFFAEAVEAIKKYF